MRCGSVIRLGGQSEPGIGQASSGDLLLHVQLKPHPLFHVLDEGDMEIELPVAPWETALGANHGNGTPVTGWATS
jgi:curved DNA-binding protein